jgi:hypothetical protein
MNLKSFAIPWELCSITLVYIWHMHTDSITKLFFSGFLVNYDCILYVGKFCCSKKFYNVEGQSQLIKSNPLKTCFQLVML